MPATTDARIAFYHHPQLRQSAVIGEYIARCRERPAYARTMGAR